MLAVHIPFCHKPTNAYHSYPLLSYAYQCLPFVSPSLSYKDKDKDLFIGLQEFVVGYSKSPEQPQSRARSIFHSHAMTSAGREPATIRTAA